MSPLQPFHCPTCWRLCCQARRPSTHYLDWQSDIARHELEAENVGEVKREVDKKTLRLFGLGFKLPWDFV